MKKTYETINLYEASYLAGAGQEIGVRLKEISTSVSSNFAPGVDAPKNFVLEYDEEKAEEFEVIKNKWGNANIPEIALVKLALLQNSFLRNQLRVTKEREKLEKNKDK